MLFAAKLPMVGGFRKNVCNGCTEVCNGFTEVCNGCTLFLKSLFPFINLWRRRRTTRRENQTAIHMGKRVRITNETLNSYGTWVLTSGLEITQFERNPVLLDMHRRGLVVGYVKDIRKEGGEVTGELVFDEASPESIRLKKQYEFGSLRMVSAGIEILELSEDPSLFLEGQTRPTVVRSRLVEVSTVDIGSNDDALVLSMDGDTLKLGKDGTNPLPLIGNKPYKTKNMELSEMALEMGLPATATEAEVKAKIADLKAAKQEAETLRSEKDNLILSAITQAVDAGIAEHRIPADKKDHFITLGKTAGLEALKTTIASMTPSQKVTAVLNRGVSVSEPGSYKKLSEVPADKLEALRDNDRPTYIALYKAEYGFEPSFKED